MTEGVKIGAVFTVGAILMGALLHSGDVQRANETARYEAEQKWEAADWKMMWADHDARWKKIECQYHLKGCK